MAAGGSGVEQEGLSFSRTEKYPEEVYPVK
jgi:hypothetical protein